MTVTDHIDPISIEHIASHARLDKLALVWGEHVADGPPAGPPGVSFSLWSAVLDKPWLQWHPGQMPDLSMYDVFLINLFHTHDSTHAQQIRDRYPKAKIIVSPDPLLDMVLTHPEWINMFDQMKIADFVACRTMTECAFYSVMLRVPCIYLSSPIGPTEWYMPYRDLPKEDLIVTLDHGFTNGITAPNVAGLANVQRQLRMKVVYVATRDYTQAYAQRAGLQAEFRGYVGLHELASLTAKARLCVDLYASHSVGRQAILSAAVGTPCITSTLCADTPGIKINPFDGLSRLALLAEQMVANSEAFRVMGFADVQEKFSFEASKKRLLDLMERLL